MSELRRDPLTDRWVIISTERAARKNDTNESKKPKMGFCPFCPGNEDKTPLPEIYSVQKNGCSRHNVFDAEQIKKSDWRVRVVPNKFPALQIESPGKRKAEGLYDKMGGLGAHEVIIETTEHVSEIPDLPLHQVVLILNTLKLRMHDLERDIRFRYLSLFKNKGEDAGASLQHPHWQLTALPITPSEVARELRCCKAHYDEKERCLICDLLSYELEKGERIVESNEAFVVLAPFASRFAGELFIAPSPDAHYHDFTGADDKTMEMLAPVLQRSLTRLSRKFNDPPYNIYMHTSPFWRKPRNWHGETIKDDYHWHIHIEPRMGKIAGFELGNDCCINTASPESVAKLLREAAV